REGQGRQVTYPLVQLVDTPEETAEVLFDFNTGWAAGNHVRAPGFTLGVPQIEGDPDAIGVEYGPRAVTFTGDIVGPRAETLTALAQLSRLLLRSKPGYLMFQLDATVPPLWLELLRPEPRDLSFD